jgi:outer membrane protein assembly factor BamB
MFPWTSPVTITSCARRGLAACLALLAGAGSVSAQADGSPRWAFATVGVLQSSPAVGPDGTIYIGANEGRTPARGYLYAINPNTRLLKFPVIQVNEDIDSAPAIGPNGEIYFGTWNGVLHALNPDGSRKWESPVGGGSAPYIASSPAVGQDGIIYIGFGDVLDPKNSGVMALTPGNAQLWRRTVDDAVDSSPAIGPDGTIYFGSWDHRVYAFNRDDGSEKWRVTTGGPVLSSPAIGLDGTVYIGSADGKVYAISPEGTTLWASPTGDRVIAAPALGADGTVYVGSTDGFFYAFERADGSLKWRRQIGPAISSSAVVRTDGTIIFGTDASTFRGMVVALNPDDGSDKWPVRYFTDDHVRSSPVIAQDGTIYVGSHDRKVHALNGAPQTTTSQYSSWPAFRHDPRHSGWSQARTSAGRLINLSTLAVAGGDANLIAGFVIQGDTVKHYLIRAVGPTLTLFGVNNPLSDPTVTVRPNLSDLRFFNNDWGDQAAGPSVGETTPQVGAFALLPASKDAAVVPLLGPDAYTAQVSSTDGSAGLALVEVYDASPAEGSSLINLSTRGRVGPTPLVPGVVVGGNDAVHVLIRAVGPGLQQFGVPGVLARPSMMVFSGQTVIKTNTGWTADGNKGDLAGAGKLAGAFPLADGSADSAALVTLPPGSHTVHISGVGGTAGEVLVEVYIVK